MVVSAAFDELTEVLQCLESSDAEVKNVEVGERMVGEKDEITADLTVGLPVLTGVELRDEVSIEVDGFDIENDRVDVDLSVSIPVSGSSPSSVGASRNSTGSNAVPSYKDPEALAAVYERYDTFPEMTEALGADVTSETVRRYMVEYDIHDPSDSRPRAHTFAASAAESDGSAQGTSSEPEADDSADGANAAESVSDAPDDTERPPDGPDGSGVTDGDPVAGADPAEPDDEREDGDPSGPDTPDSDIAGESVAELIAARDSEDSDDSLVADGLGIPKGLTAAELAAIVNEANTLYEAKERLDMDRDHARRLLGKLDLIDLVTRRLGADQITVSPAEIQRRIDLDGFDSPR